jgi:hypothetical protein
MTVHGDWEARRRRRLEDQKRTRRRVALPRDPKLPEWPLYEVDQAAAILRLSPGYVKKLCDTRKLRYVVRTYRHGWMKRRVRLIPERALAEYWVSRLRFYMAMPPRPLEGRDPAGGRTDTGGGGGEGDGTACGPQG